MINTEASSLSTNTPHLGLLRRSPRPRRSAAEADRAQFKPKLLVRLAEVHGRHVPQGQKARPGRAELQDGLRLSLAELGDTDGESEGGRRGPTSPLRPAPAPPPYPAAIVGDLDGGRHCSVERRLLAVGPQEADRAAVVTRSFVQPGRRVLAGKGEALLRRGAQQSQEVQLDHVHWGPISVHVGELGCSRAGGEGAP